MRPGVNTGRALMSIGDDVLTYGRDNRNAELQERLARMREERETDMLRLRAELLGLGGRASSAGTRGAGGAGGLVSGAMSDELMAANAGVTLPEFQAGRDFNRQGPQSEVKATADSPGMEYADPADREQLRAAGGMSGETVGSMTGRKHAGAAREALILSQVDPKDRKPFEEGRSVANARTRAFAGDADVPDVSRRVAASEGKPMSDIKDDTNFDPFAPPDSPTSTPLGKAREGAEAARAGAWRAEAGKDNRTDPNRPRTTGGRGVEGLDDRTLAQALETQRKVVSDLNKDFSKGAKERKPQEIARLNLLQAEQDRRLGLSKTAGQSPATAKKPDIASVQGAPKGAVIGAQSAKGWEVRDAAGKLLGYVR